MVKCKSKPDTKIEQRSRNIIKPKSSRSNELRIPSLECAINKRMCPFVFECLQNNVCHPFQNYYVRRGHGQYTRNNKLAVKVPRMRREFGRKSFSVSAANVFNKLPILTRHLDSRVFI